MKRNILVWIGFGFLFCAFIFDVTFSNIPAQDATADLIARQNNVYWISLLIYGTGLLFMVAAAILFIIRKLKNF